MLASHEGLSVYHEPNPTKILGCELFSELKSIQYDPEFMREATHLTIVYDVKPMYTPALAILIKNGILGEEADAAGFGNIGRHCVLSGKGSVLGTDHLMRLPPTLSFWTNNVNFLHDRNKRHEIEARSLGMEIINGHARHRYGKDYYHECEETTDGVFDATSMIWRHKTWGIPHMMAREIDTLTGPELLPDGTLGEDIFQPWDYRCDVLQLRKSEASQEYGDRYYGGMPAFVYLKKELMPYVDTALYNLTKQTNPGLIKKYSSIINPSMPFGSILLYEAQQADLPVLNYN